jgi:L-asparagine oxygenase
MNQTILSESEIKEIKLLLSEVTARYKSVEDADFLKNAPLLAHDLPKQVRAFLNDFRQLEMPSGVCVISAYPVDDRQIGRTPDHWKSRDGVSSALEEEVLFTLFASLLGDCIGWATQQNGYIIHDVLPIKDDELLQIGTGSQQTIWWHNEDAFHPYRGDYVGLMCLRNPNRVPTTFACMDMIELDPRHIKILFEPRFIIRPDESHAMRNTEGAEGDDEFRAFVQYAYKSMSEEYRAPSKLAVLFGDPQSPYLRLDPYFMDPLEDDEAQSALNALIREIDWKLSEIILQPGDCLFVDNYRAVHGRKSFKANYDGNDRWLKRTNIARDLRKSRAARRACTSRIIF